MLKNCSYQYTYPLNLVYNVDIRKKEVDNMYTIKEIAVITEENEHTIRYYAKLGLFPNIARDKYNTRVFSDADLDDVRMVICLADTGMPLEQVKQFMELEKQGNDTYPERYQILKEHQNNARSKLVKLQKEVQLIEWKTYQYQQKARNR